MAHVEHRVGNGKELDGIKSLPIAKKTCTGTLLIHRNPIISVQLAKQSLAVSCADLD